MIKKIRNFFLILIGSIVLILVLAIIFISPLTKYLIEKYDEQYTGRQATLDWAFVNPFTGTIHLNNLKIYEYKTDSVFFSVDGFDASVSLNKLMSKTYEIYKLNLDNPKIIITKTGKNAYNFDDLIKKFTAKDTLHPKDTTLPKDTLHFNILNIKINNGILYFDDNQVPIHYSIKKLNVETDGKYWNRDTISVKYSFVSGIGTGDMKGVFSMNLAKLDYKLTTTVTKFDLELIEQYFKALSKYGTFEANLDADIIALGNFLDAQAINVKGSLAINDFHFGKTSNEDYISFDKFFVEILELDPKRKKYTFDSLVLLKPFFKFELYDHLDNFQRMFGKNGSQIAAAKAQPEKFNLILEISDYVQKLAQNFLKSQYKIIQITIKDASILYNDYSISEKFAIALDPLTITSDSIDKTLHRVLFNVRSGIKPYGNLAIDLSINPKDYTDFDLTYNFKNISAPSFNPYIISYTSFPLNRGSIETKGSWTVRKGIINSSNHFLVTDPRTAKRLKNNDTKWIPVPFLMFFIRDLPNVIDYNIPITGNLKNPKFHLHQVIFDILRNIIVKPATFPYQLKVKKVQDELETLHTIEWQLHQTKLKRSQEKFIDRIADFLSSDGKTKIQIKPYTYEIKEKEYILLFEAKKKYFMLQHQLKTNEFTSKDSVKVERMSAKDSMFVRYLDNHIGHKLAFTIQEKCAHFIGNNIVNKKYEELLAKRNEEFLSFFKKNGTDKLVIIHKNQVEIPYNGFSFFRIKYEGDIPKNLMKAYDEMNTLNESEPRKQYYDKDAE